MGPSAEQPGIIQRRGRWSWRGVRPAGDRGLIRPTFSELLAGAGRRRRYLQPVRRRAAPAAGAAPRRAASAAFPSQPAARDTGCLLSFVGRLQRDRGPQAETETLLAEEEAAHHRLLRYGQTGRKR